MGVSHTPLDQKRELWDSTPRFAGGCCRWAERMKTGGAAVIYVLRQAIIASSRTGEDADDYRMRRAHRRSL